MSAHIHPKIIACCILLIFLCASANAQLKTNIKANGITRKPGDTILSCRGNAVIFENIGIPNTTVNWVFKNGTPATGSGNGPFEITYTQNGVDSVIRYTQSGNNIDTTVFFVNVTDTKPVPAFSFPPGQGCASVEILFTNTTAGTNTYYWDFGDGGTSRAVSPTHRFLQATGNETESFEVKLVATNAAGCKDSVTHTVTVKQIPSGKLESGDPDVDVTIFNGIQTFRKCLQLNSYTFSFKNKSSTTATNKKYTFNWGDSSPPRVLATWTFDDTVAHVFSLGNTSVTLTIEGENGCISVTTFNVFLGTNPQAAIKNPGSSEICEGDSLYFLILDYENDPPGTSYTFTFSDDPGNPQIVDPNISDTVWHQFNRSSCGNTSDGIANSFSATLIVANPCKTTPLIAPGIYVSGKPKPAMLTDTVVCKNATITIQNTTFFGNVVVVNDGVSNCVSQGRQVWTVSPPTGAVYNPGDLGSLNGSVTNWANWQNGAAALNITFTTAGIYTVKLYVSNETSCGGVDSIEQKICVREAPIAAYSFLEKELCEAGTLTLNNTSPAGACNGDAYYWAITYSDPLNCSINTGGPYSFINGTTDTSKNPLLQLNAAGQYVIKLTTSELNYANTCPPADITDTFFVKGKPKVSINPLPQICADRSISPSAVVSVCYDSSRPIYNWVFNGGDPGSSEDSLPNAVKYNDTGTYTITFAVTNTCGTATAADSVKVISIPIADAGINMEMCSGDTVAIGMNTGDGLTYRWSPATGLTNTSEAITNVSLTYTGPNADTTYEYALTVSAGTDCETTDTVLVKVKKTPLVSVLPAGPSICIGGSILLVADGALSYIWSPSSTLSSSNRDSVTASPDTTTTYTVTGFGGNSCSSTYPVTVTVYNDAVAEFSAGTTEGCTIFDLGKTITVNTYPDRNGTYEWYANGVSIGNTTDGSFPGYKLDTAGQSVTIQLIATSNSGCKADSMEIQFTSVAAAIANFSPSAKTGCEPLSVSFSNTSNIISGTQFFWDFGNGTTSTAAQPPAVKYSSSVYGSDSTYYITLKAYNGCDTTYHTDTVKVYAKPKARFGVDSTFGCSPYIFDINNSSYGNPSVYYWDFGNGDKDTLTNNATFSYEYNTGFLQTFRLQLIAENACARDTQGYDIVVAPNIIQPFINVNGSDLYSCAPHTVTFNNNSIGATLFTWHFGDTSSPLVTTNYNTVVTHPYTDPGTYTIQIDITNGCTDTTLYRQTTLYAPPMAVFTINDSLFCIYDTVKTVNNSRDADALRISWGDGSPVNSNSFDHVYSTPGTYSITFYADRVNSIGIVCTDAVQKTITVYGKPNTALLTNIKPVNCAPFTLNASATAITTENTSWNIYDSTTGTVIYSSTQKELQYEFTGEGTYRLKLTAVNAAGCVDSTSSTFRVLYTPVAGFDPQSINTCTQDTTVTYINNSTYAGTGPLNYTWLVNGTVAASSETFSYRYIAGTPLPQTFTTWLITANTAGCADTATASLTVNPLAVAAFSVTNPNTCIPFELALKNESENALAYKWLLNGTDTGTADIPTIYITNASAVYTLTLIAYNYAVCSADTATYTFTSLAKPEASFTLNDTLGCSGSFNAITTNTTNGGINYTWDWDDGTAASTGFEPAHLYTATGEYRLQMVADNNTCKDTAIQMVRVDNKPTADFTVSDTAACGAYTVKFINLSRGATAYAWDFGDATSSTASDPQKNYEPSASPYSVRLTAISRYGCKDSVTKPNIVLAKVPPDAGFIISPSPVINIPDYTFSFYNTTVFNTYYRYLWNLDDGTFSAERDVVHKYRDTGSYSVSLIVLDTLSGCTDTAIQLAQVKGIPGYMYVPNAFSPGSIRQELRTFLPKATGLKTFRMEIYTTWGQKIFETTSLDAAGRPTEGWDGTFNGKQLQQDSYVWKITAFFLNGTEWPGMKYPYSDKYTRVGSVTIVR